MRRREQPGFRQFLLKAPGEDGNGAAHQVLLGRRGPGISTLQRSWYLGCRFAGAADARDGKLLSQTNDNVRNTWQDVHVFMPIEVRRQNTGAQYLQDLLPKLNFHLGQFDLPGHDAHEQQGRSQIQPSLEIGQSANLARL